MSDKQAPGLERLKQAHSDLSAKEAARADSLNRARARLEKLPGLLLDASEKERPGLLEEFGRLQAQVQVERAELHELRRRRALAYLKIFEFKEEQAQDELVRYIEEVNRPAIAARDKAIEDLRIAMNRPETLGIADRGEIAQEIVRLRVAKEQAISEVAYVTTPHAEDLRHRRDEARQEKTEALEELAALSIGEL